MELVAQPASDPTDNDIVPPPPSLVQVSEIAAEPASDPTDDDIIPPPPSLVRQTDADAPPAPDRSTSRTPAATIQRPMINLLQPSATQFNRIKCSKRGNWNRDHQDRWFDFSAPGEITYWTEATGGSQKGTIVPISINNAPGDAESNLSIVSLEPWTNRIWHNQSHQSRRTYYLNCEQPGRTEFLRHIARYQYLSYNAATRLADAGNTQAQSRLGSMFGNQPPRRPRRVTFMHGDDLRLAMEHTPPSGVSLAEEFHTLMSTTLRSTVAGPRRPRELPVKKHTLSDEIIKELADEVCSICQDPFADVPNPKLEVAAKVTSKQLDAATPAKYDKENKTLIPGRTGDGDALAEFCAAKGRGAKWTDKTDWSDNIRALTVTVWAGLDPCVAGRDISEVQCGGKHKFHEACLTQWTTRRKTCPVCRFNAGDAVPSAGRAAPAGPPAEDAPTVIRAAPAGPPAEENGNDAEQEMYQTIDHERRAQFQRSEAATGDAESPRAPTPRALVRRLAQEIAAPNTRRLHHTNSPLPVRRRNAIDFSSAARETLPYATDEMLASGDDTNGEWRLTPRPRAANHRRGGAADGADGDSDDLEFFDTSDGATVATPTPDGNDAETPAADDGDDVSRSITGAAAPPEAPIVPATNLTHHPLFRPVPPSNDAETPAAGDGDDVTHALTGYIPLGFVAPAAPPVPPIVPATNPSPPSDLRRALEGILGRDSSQSTRLSEWLGARLF